MCGTHMWHKINKESTYAYLLGGFFYPSCRFHDTYPFISINLFCKNARQDTIWNNEPWLGG
jgi:hypothetical protein